MQNHNNHAIFRKASIFRQYQRRIPSFQPYPPEGKMPPARIYPLVFLSLSIYKLNLLELSV